MFEPVGINNAIDITAIVIATIKRPGRLLIQMSTTATRMINIIIISFNPQDLKIVDFIFERLGMILIV